MTTWIGQKARGQVNHHRAFAVHTKRKILLNFCLPILCDCHHFRKTAAQPNAKGAIRILRQNNFGFFLTTPFPPPAHCGPLHLCCFLAVGPLTRDLCQAEENKCCYKLSKQLNAHTITTKEGPLLLTRFPYCLRVFHYHGYHYCNFWLIVPASGGFSQ